MGILYADGGKVYCHDYMEIYVPQSYFDAKPPIAINLGSSIQTFGMCYVQPFKSGNPDGPIKMLNVPVLTQLMMYDFHNTVIRVHGRSVDVVALAYMKDSYVMHQTVVKGREVASDFLDLILDAKLPNTLNYRQLIDLWWRNLEIADVSLKVPSKIYELILASIYRNPNNPKKRYGQLYGKQTDPSGYDYRAQSVRSVVRDLSTFAGMAFEDMYGMISSGIDNSVNNVEEPESPLEKIIHY